MKSFFDVLTVILLFLTFLAGAGVLFTGDVINKRQENQLRQFEKDLTTAKDDLAKQQERAANAEKETAKLKILATGRELMSEQSKQISRALERFKGRQVFISSYIGDAEAARLGLQIKAALVAAGISVTDMMGSTYAAPNDSGGVSFGIGVSCLSQQKDLASAIAGALRNSHLEAKEHVVQSMLKDRPEVGIMVGARPLPRIE